MPAGSGLWFLCHTANRCENRESATGDNNCSQMTRKPAIANPVKPFWPETKGQDPTFSIINMPNATHKRQVIISICRIAGQTNPGDLLSCDL